ncbi:MAG: EamA family transporter [Chloroflexi bacterium]|nr:EamA family transporter [Chloroflexota bacterium]
MAGARGLVRRAGAGPRGRGWHRRGRPPGRPARVRRRACAGVLRPGCAAWVRARPRPAGRSPDDGRRLHDLHDRQRRQRQPGPAGGTDVVGRGLWPVLVAGVIGAGIPTVAYITGIRMLGPSRAAILATLEPVVAVALAAWLLAELPTLLQVVGGILILLAAVLLQLRSQSAADHEAVAG